METAFRWASMSEDVEGFIIEEDSCGIIDWEIGSLVPISDVGAEIILLDYLKILTKIFSINEIKYFYSDGIKLNRLVFMPPTISDDRDVKAFPSLQRDLSDVYMDYHREGGLTVDLIEDARDSDVLKDFLLLLNCESYLTANFRKA
jgi:hypothetical protein